MTGRSTTPCRVLVGGYGRPGMRDLDFGRQVVECLQQFDWPDEVVVEDLSYSAPLVLNRLQELRPAKVVLVGAVARALDPPATLRRYRLNLTPPDPREVTRSVEESVMGLVDLDHTLAMARHWGGLPADTVIIEVEPAEAEFGLGFSEELALCLDPILDMVREELDGIVAGAPELEPDREPVFEAPAAPSEALDELVTYAEDHAHSRRHRRRAPQLPPSVAGVAVAGEVRPWGVYVEDGGDWFDAVPLAGGGLGIVVGAVAGRGVAATDAMRDLRAAARAYAVIDGASPGRMLDHLDDLAVSTGMGRGARVLYVTVDPSVGEVRYSSAGACAPLVLSAARAGGEFVGAVAGAPLGDGEPRKDATLHLPVGATLLLFTAGLVESRSVPRRVGMERLRAAAAEGPTTLEGLCRHVVDACASQLRRDDDICLVGVRLTAAAQDETDHRAAGRLRFATRTAGR